MEAQVLSTFINTYLLGSLISFSLCMTLRCIIKAHDKEDWQTTFAVTVSSWLGVAAFIYAGIKTLLEKNNANNQDNENQNS